MNKPFGIKDNTPEEEAEIQRQIAEDPDAWPTAPDAEVLKRGRPLGRTKEQVMVRRKVRGQPPSNWAASIWVRRIDVQLS